MPASAGDLLHADMQRGAGARRRVGHLAGILLGEVDHVLPGLELRLGAGGDAEGVAGEVNDVGEVLGRIPGDFLHQRQAEHRDRNLRDGVAVGLGGGRHGGRADRAAAAGLVVDRDRLAENLRGAVGDRAHRDVGRAARRPRHDQRDRLGRIFLRAGGGRHQHADGGDSDASNGDVQNMSNFSLAASLTPRPRYCSVTGLNLPRNRLRRKARIDRGGLRCGSAIGRKARMRQLACRGIPSRGI